MFFGRFLLNLKFPKLCELGPCLFCVLYLSCSKPLDVVAIDHLPSVLPRESSEKFANKMTPYLMKLVEVRKTRKGPGKRGHVVVDTLLLLMFLGRANAQDTK